MNNIILTVAIAAVASSAVMAQNENQKLIDNYKKSIEASNKDIQDAKKSSNVKTWENRGKLMVEASKANIKGVYAGMPASKSDANPFNNLVLMMGEPNAKSAGDPGIEIWEYPTINFYVQNDQIQYWKEKYVADENALEKASEAYRKANDLTAGYKDKKTTKDLIKDLRNAFFNDGINSYYLKNYEDAAKKFEGALNLEDFPRAENDTMLLDGQIAYYAGLCAYQAGKKEEATKLFTKAADLDYQPGSCYHYVYQIYMDLGQDEQGFKVLSEAYKKFPGEESILYDVINYYLGKKQYKEAEDYLNKAIAEHPDNLVLYNVKASMFVTEYGNIKTQYEKDIEKISQLKKEAFRQRNNPTEKARVESEIISAEKAAAETKEKFMANQAKAKACYNDALAKKSDDYNSLFMLGILAYDEAELIAIEKNAIPLSEDKDGSKAAAKDEQIHKCWKQSCEWFEKAYQSDPKQKNPLTNLKMLYYKLGDTANNKRVKDLLDNFAE